MSKTVIYERKQQKTQEVHFILVHIHRSYFPEYIYTCIEQIRTTNEQASIWLAYYSSCDGIDYRRLNRLGCRLIDLRKHLWSWSHFRFKVKNRGIFTTERFYVIYEIMKQHNLKNVIHVENDVMVYADVSKLMPIFNENYEMGLVRESDTLCIGGVVYIKAAQSLKSLCRFFLKQKDVNDMTAISLYGYKEGMDYLPVVSRDYTQEQMMTYMSNSGEQIAVKRPDIYCKNIEKFKCIFDGCAYGQYVGGIDKKLSKEDTTGYINKHVCHSAEKCSIIWEVLDNKKVPFYVYGKEKYPIVNLHIHSKELEKYKSCK